MSIETTTARIQYSGDGTQTDFPYNFLIHAEGDLRVSTITSAGVESVQTLNAHYTVSGAGTGSGTVAFATAPASGLIVNIERNTARTQTVDLVENDSFPAETNEGVYDKLTMMIQEMDENLDRTIRQNRLDTANIGTLPVKADRLGNLLGFDSNGDPIAVAADIDTALVSSFGEAFVATGTASSGRSLLGFITGTFTPTLSFLSSAGDLAVTYTLQQGFYVRFGKLAWVGGFVSTDSAAFTHTTASGNLYVAGNPVIPDLSYQDAIGQCVMVGDADSTHRGHFCTVNSVGQIRIYGVVDGSYTEVNHVDVPTTSTVWVRWSIVYLCEEI